MRKIDRVKKFFVEDGLEIALNGKNRNRIYTKKVDGDFEAHLEPIRKMVTCYNFYNIQYAKTGTDTLILYTYGDISICTTDFSDSL